MKKIFLLLVVFLYALTLQADVESELKKHFYTKFKNIRLVIKQNCNDKDNLHNELKNILVPMFDFELMAKLSLGKTQWKRMSKTQRNQFIDVYTYRMKSSYSTKLESFDDEEVVIGKVARKKNRVSLYTTIKTKDKILDVVYKLYKPKKHKIDKEEWLIYDVQIIGISILKADKAQFRDYLQTKNIIQLMDALASQK